MKNIRLLSGLLFVMLLLGVVGIGQGLLSSAANQSFQTPSWVKGIGTVLAQAQPLHLNDLSPISPNCVQQEEIVVQAGSSCLFAVKPATFTLRTLALQFLQGTGATVILAQEGVLTVQQQIAVHGSTNANFKIYPGKTQGILTLQCISTQNQPPCLFSLQ